MQTPQPLSDPRLVVLHDVEYFIFWDQVPIGASFFLPTTATPRQALDALKPASKALKIKLEARPRREYGRYGVRVWRVG